MCLADAVKGKYAFNEVCLQQQTGTQLQDTAGHSVIPTQPPQDSEQTHNEIASVRIDM